MGGWVLRCALEGRGGKGGDREGNGEGEKYHPARPLLAGEVVFWQGWEKLGVRGGDRWPGPWIGPLGGRGETWRHELVARWNQLGAGNELIARGWSWETRWHVSGSGLHVAVVGAGGKGVTCLTTVRTEPNLEPTASFVEGEWPTRPTSTVQIHGDMLVWERGREELALGWGLGWERGLVRVWGRLVGLRGEGGARRVGFLLICSRLIMLYGNGGGDVSLKRGRYISPCY